MRSCYTQQTRQWLMAVPALAGTQSNSNYLTAGGNKNWYRGVDNHLTSRMKVEHTLALRFSDTTSQGLICTQRHVQGHARQLYCDSPDQKTAWISAVHWTQWRCICEGLTHSQSAWTPVRMALQAQCQAKKGNTGAPDNDPTHFGSRRNDSGVSGVREQLSLGRRMEWWLSWPQVCTTGW